MIFWRQVLEQDLQVRLVLRSVGRNSQKLGRHEVACTRHRDQEAWNNLDGLGIPADLGLDGRGREQQVDDDTFLWLTRRQEPYRGQPAQCCLLERQSQGEP